MTARVLLITGKGGVGKSTVAASTALGSADHGHRTLLISTDPAHSLGDVLKRRLAHRPRKVADRLWARELDVHRAIEEHWGVVRDFVSRFLQSQGVEDVLADELAILPGTEELVHLLTLESHLAGDEWDTVVVDCAPTASTIRLLGFPDTFHRSLARLFPKGRTLARVLRPMAEAYLDAPIPDSPVFDQLETLDQRLERLQRALTTHRRTTARIVLTAEGPVVRESQRILAVLHLLGLSVDAVILNRMGAENGARRIQSWFEPTPLLTAELRPREPLGSRMLRRLSSEIYGDGDPTRVLAVDRPTRIRKKGSGYVMVLELPVPDTRDLRVDVLGDVLRVEVSGFRKHLVLPRRLQGREVVDAELAEGRLSIHFADVPSRA